MTDNRQLILATIKQNPLYSVDKLHQVLPQFSRHFVQKVRDGLPPSGDDEFIRLDYRRAGIDSESGFPGSFLRDPKVVEFVGGGFLRPCEIIGHRQKNKKCEKQHSAYS